MSTLKGSHAAQKYNRMKNVGCQASESTYITEWRPTVECARSSCGFALTLYGICPSVRPFPPASEKKPKHLDKTQARQRDGHANAAKGSINHFVTSSATEKVAQVRLSHAVVPI
jgi:hypothetical protein